MGPGGRLTTPKWTIVSPDDHVFRIANPVGGPASSALPREWAALWSFCLKRRLRGDQLA